MIKSQKSDGVRPVVVDPLHKVHRAPEAPISRVLPFCPKTDKPALKTPTARICRASVGRCDHAKQRTTILLCEENYLAHGHGRRALGRPAVQVEKQNKMVKFLFFN